ncbi:MAG TPA: D-alanine--D-alanine ligase family protein [Pyrinomonadaceae bacterium]|nr:D-alanine--D-alanine ligase family protein [Pyrinomonadaceae bacterium]
MANKLRVGVVFGGRSGEHEISIRSAQAVVEAIDQKKYEVIPIAITKEGKWLAPAAAASLLPAITQKRLSNEIVSQGGGDVAILGDPSHQGLTKLTTRNNEPAQKLDVVFPVLHGPYGEDGTLQGLLEMADVPYVGCGVVASACGMDKVAMKMLFAQSGLPLCKYVWFLRSAWQRDQTKVLRRVDREIGFPCFVKPANLGSSVGISKALDKASLIKAIDLAAEYDRKVIVEELVDGRELECAVLGNDEPIASLPGEYVVRDEAARFLDYTEKYSSTGHVEFVVPAPVSKALSTKIQRLAIQAFQSVDGSGLARVDFFVGRRTNKLLINELNTLPGLTEVSGYPKMWAASGLPFSRLLERLIELAFERHQDKLKTKKTI